MEPWKQKPIRVYCQEEVSIVLMKCEGNEDGRWKMEDGEVLMRMDGMDGMGYVQLSAFLQAAPCAQRIE